MNVMRPAVGAACSAKAALSGDKPGEKIKPPIPQKHVELDELPQGVLSLLAQLQPLHESALKLSLAPLGIGKKVEAKAAAERTDTPRIEALRKQPTVEVGQVPAQLPMTISVPVPVPFSVSRLAAATPQSAATVVRPERPIPPMDKAAAVPPSPQAAAVVQPQVKVEQTPLTPVALGAGMDTKLPPRAKAEKAAPAEAAPGPRLEAAAQPREKAKKSAPAEVALGLRAETAIQPPVKVEKKMLVEPVLSHRLDIAVAPPQAKAESVMLRQLTVGPQVDAVLKVLTKTTAAVPGVVTKGHQKAGAPQVITPAPALPAQQVTQVAPTVMLPVTDLASGADVTQVDIPETASIDTLQSVPAQPLPVSDKTPRAVVAPPPAGQPQVVADPQAKPEVRFDGGPQQYLQVPFSKGEATGLITVTKAGAEHSQQLLLSPNNSGVANHLSDSLAHLNAPLWRLADQQHREQRGSRYPDDQDDTAEEGTQQALPVERDSV
ncbi:hypothetical protein RBU55_18510 [Pseudomonas chlororaphis subsp. aurantiaca]|uniref:SpaN/EivJ family type III secretion system needle length determinant n=1 Tax=Pseudomonas chlororaphis TaxID=587753 RepID=UPI0027DCF6E7|nr:hypothetical protein [Pseudomonas chlororaphis]WMI97559.1 hypothetical protein RBU55_18510 [Pseudomonas chlororaphis subsp. aurantiaca]